jgi:hypothetical protein
LDLQKRAGFASPFFGERAGKNPVGFSTFLLQKRGWLRQTFFANLNRPKGGFYFWT